MAGKKYMGFLILISLLSCHSKKDINLKIVPPFNDVEVPLFEIKIDPTKDQVAKFENGVSVEIPKNAFVDLKGNLITEEVTLTLNTFNSPADIIASGIPMTFKNDETSGNFESAGMFQIEGSTSSREVYIDKALTVNYPSKVFGKYDFFQFKETDSDSIKTGHWKKLTNDSYQNENFQDTLNKFQLRFASNEYPELLPLSSISWKLATEFCNPNTNENSWALDEEWASLEISKPKYGLGKLMMSSGVNYDDYLGFGAVMVTEDNSRIITSKKPTTKIWTNDGALVKSIDKVKSVYEPVKILNQNLLIIKRENGDYIYNLDGEELGKLPPCHNQHLDSSGNVILYNKNGLDPTVYMYFIAEKTTKSIKLKEDDSDLFNPGISEHFILTPQDEIITNSLDGIEIYNLDGKKLKQKTGHYSYIDYATENTLMIKELNGTLTIWDYKTGKEITSKKSFFNLEEKLINNIWHSSYFFHLPNTTYIVINQAGTDNSILWNYQQNEIDTLSFAKPYFLNFHLPNNLIDGYNSKEDIYHLYDIDAKKDIIKIPDFGHNIFWEGSYYVLTISPDKSKVLISDYNQSKYYDLNGKLIRDFKDYDASIFTNGFVNNDSIFTLSENGIYRLWNKNGNEISNTQFDNSEHITGYTHDNEIITWNNIFRTNSYYDQSGNLMLNHGRTWLNSLLDFASVIHVDHNDSLILKSLFPLNPTFHQLTVRTEDTEFITYVYLNENDLQKIYKYYTLRAKRIATEIERQEDELKTLRRFQIKEFGIYNWDILLKESNSIEFSADFKFNVPTDYANMTIFLITEINGPAVIKFDRNSWGKFGINPNAKNKILAVLPDNKVAVFDDFSSIDFNKLSIDKNYVFNMKTLDQPINSLSELESALQN